MFPNPAGSLLKYPAGDIFKRQADQQPLYETLVRMAIHTVKPEQVAMFLDK